MQEPMSSLSRGIGFVKENPIAFLQKTKKNSERNLSMLMRC